MYIIRHKQRGVTMVELMVAMVVGLLVLAGVMTVYISTLKTSNTTLDSSRLNQEMAAILNVMASDIRRAGYNGGADPRRPSENPFNVVDTTTPANTTALRVYATADNGATYNDKTDELPLSDRAGSCIVYTYDADADGTVDNDEKYGFRWDTQTDDGLMMRTSTTGTSNDCTTAGVWESVTDTSLVEITGLTFDMSQSKCLNTAEPDGADRGIEGGAGDGNSDELAERDCYRDEVGTENVLDYPAAVAADPPETTVEARIVEITLEARLKDEPKVKGKMSQTVQVRNHLVRVR